MSKTKGAVRFSACKARCVVVLILLLRCSPASAQWMIGGSAHTLILPSSNNDYNSGSALSMGISIELGHEFFFGWIFLEGTWINHMLVYNQSVPEIYHDQSGQTVVYLASAGSYGGREFAAGFQSGQGSTAYFPGGPQYFVSASYCYPLDSLIMFGPIIGIGLQNQISVPAATIEDPYQSGVFSSPVYGPPSLSSSGKVIVGNFGLSVKLSIGGTLMLEYATKTGAGLGYAILF
jgi:hypothetical protein